MTALHKLLLTLIFCAALLLDSYADQNHYTIVTLASSGKARSENKWKNTVLHFEALTGDKYSIIHALNFQDLEKLIKDKKADYIFLPPTYMLDIQSKYGFRPFMSLAVPYKNQLVTSLASVLFTLSDNKEINNIEDIKGKKIAAYNENCFAYLATLREIKKAGIDIKKEIEVYFTGSLTENVRFVLEKKAELGIVRNGFLESMIKEGKLQKDKLKIVGEIKDGFPYPHTSRLYPEWYFGVAEHVDERHSSRLATKLLRASYTTEESDKIMRWVIANDLTPVNELLEDLGLNHYQNSDIEYFYEILKKIILVILTALTAFVISYYFYSAGKNSPK